MSCSGGRYSANLSEDHKPNDAAEHARIVRAGGRTYQTQSLQKMQPEPGSVRRFGHETQQQLVLGPHRVYPGRLSVSRTFGDIEAKRVKYGGNPKVVIATPDIKCFKIEDNYDFIVLGCDGIFDKLSNMQCIQATWESSRKNYKDRGQTIHSVCGLGVEKVMKASVAEKTADNITVVVIAFKNFKKCLKNEIDLLQG